jgi:dipeptidase E
MKHLLLISTSTIFGTQYLEHAFDEITSLLGPARRVLFVPYALKDHDGYAAKVRTTFGQLGYDLESIHELSDALTAVNEAQAIFVGGGNTFRLLKTLYDNRLLQHIRARVLEGMPYSGASAGSNLACPTIRTTNDMPIVEPPSLEALNLVPFQLNPHYFDPDPLSTHMGETRETRIHEFHEENTMPVVGLREGAMLRVDDDRVQLRGCAGARIFRRGQPPAEVAPGSDLNAYVGGN